MHVKRFNDANAYDAPNHRACTSLRLFGAEARSEEHTSELQSH